jgi:hypothetical protein
MRRVEVVVALQQVAEVVALQQLQTRLLEEEHMASS